MKVCLKFLSFRKTKESHQWPQFLAVMSAAFLAIGSGVQNAWPSPSIPKLLSKDLGFEVTEEEASYVVMIGPLGFVLGSPLCGFLLDRIGRKYTLMFFSIPELVPWILIGSSNNIAMIYVARFIMGMADGALFTAFPVYVAEISEPIIRGVLGSFHSFGMISGALLINIYGSYVPIRTSAYISLVFPIIFLITFIWMPESPYYLLMKERPEAARSSLIQLRRMKNVDVELSRIAADVKRQISEPGTLKDIFIIKSNLKGFLIIFGLRTLQQLSGIVVLYFYIQIIFKQAGGSVTPAESAIICCSVQCVVIIFASYLVDMFGRRPTLLMSTSGCGVLLVILGVYFLLQSIGYDLTSLTWLPVVIIVLYNVIGAMGLLIVTNVMAGELLSASIKSKALGILNMYLGLCVSAASKLFQALDYSFGMHVPFFVFGACCLVGIGFVYFVVPETKGKTLEEIQQFLKGFDDPKCDTKNNNVVVS